MDKHEEILSKKQEKWLTLNQHGKACLRAFLMAISASDLLTTQVDYLVSKELIDSVIRLRDISQREDIAGYALTDLGIYTAAHYFPRYTNWGKTIEWLEQPKTT